MTDWTCKVELLLAGSWRGATSALISNGRHHVVVDTGMPHEAHQLLKALEQKGLSPGDIKTLVNTHFHIDHVLNNDLFPSAEVYATQLSYDWCQSLYSDIADNQNWEKLALNYYPEMYDYEKAYQHMAKLRKFTLRWWDLKRLGSPERFRWLEAHSLPDGIESFITSGHVPGHVSLVIRTGEQSTVIAGDALLSRTHEEQVATMIPHNRDQFLQDRTRVLEMGGRILPGHDGAFCCGSESRIDLHTDETARD
jgi:glyoxylase-like metal-dependent hydrolase (beta-lactamase superfamily II)